MKTARVKKLSRPPSCGKMQQKAMYPLVIDLKKSSPDLWHRCRYSDVSTDVCVCVRRCPTQSIPLHSARPPQNKQLHQAPKNEKQIKRCGRLPERAAADCVRPYQWPCQPDDTVHTHTRPNVPDAEHTRTPPVGLPLGCHFVSSRVRNTLLSYLAAEGAIKL